MNANQKVSNSKADIDTQQQRVLLLYNDLNSIFHKKDIEQYLWLFLKSALSSVAYHHDTEEPQDREDIIFFYEKLKELFEVC